MECEEADTIIIEIEVFEGFDEGSLFCGEVVRFLSKFCLEFSLESIGFDIEG
jgi:hypothetical protein